MDDEDSPQEFELENEIEPEKDIDFVQLTGIYADGHILVEWSPTTEILHEKNYFGIKTESNQLELEIIEALLLKERNRIELVDSEGKSIKTDYLIAEVSQKDSQIWIRYLVYRDLRQRGYIVRLGFGSGIDFRVFPRGANPQTDIAKYFIYILEEENAIHLDTLDVITTQTISARKNLILATVDRLGDITYYQLEQFSLPTNTQKEKKW